MTHRQAASRLPGAVLLVTLFLGVASCQSILIYDNNSHDHIASLACTNLGFVHTVANSGTFTTELTSQTWDLVIMDMPSTEPSGAWTTELSNHIAAGGAAIQTHWASASLTALLTAFEISSFGGHDTLPFYQWNSHALFTTPNSVPDLTLFQDEWGTNGFFLEPTGSAVSAAGFTPAPTPNQAAIVIGNGGRTIFNGFIFDDYDSHDQDADTVWDIIELAENEILYVLGGASCTITLPPSPAGEVVDIDVDGQSTMSASVDVLVEFSTDAGATWTTATMDAASPNPNPAAGLPLGPALFQWDSRGDGVGISSVATGVVIQATVTDGVSAVPGICSDTVDIDNTALCYTICGDCDQNGIAPAILDALVAAQIAAALVVPTSLQEGCCDVDSTSTVTVLDALLMAQSAASLPVTLTCL